MRHEAYINLQATRNVVYVDLTIPNIRRKIYYLLQQNWNQNDNRDILFQFISMKTLQIVKVAKQI